MVLPIKDIEAARKEKSYHWSNWGLVTVIRGHEELFFGFCQEISRDACLQILQMDIEAAERESMERHDRSGEGDPSRAPDQAWFETMTSRNERLETRGDLSDLAERSDEDTSAIMFDSSAVSMISFKPTESLHFTCLTIGSRGDVQPYIALCKVISV